MADDVPKQDQSRVRKTVTFTQKQFGIGSGVGAALLAIQPLTNMFLTNDKAETMRVQISHLATVQSEIKTTLAQNKAELITNLAAGNKMIIESITAAEGRTSQVDRRHDRLIERLQSRLDSYEASVNNRSSRNKN